MLSAVSRREGSDLLRVVLQILARGQGGLLPENLREQFRETLQAARDLAAHTERLPNYLDRPDVVSLAAQLKALQADLELLELSRDADGARQAAAKRLLEKMERASAFAG